MGQQDHGRVIGRPLDRRRFLDHLKVTTPEDVRRFGVEHVAIGRDIMLT